MQRKHARFSASSSERWLNCAASIRMEEKFPEVTSKYAEYGTAAHELAERCLIVGVPAFFYAGKSFNGYEADDEMVEAVQRYLDYVNDHIGTRLVEQKVDYSPWAPEGFGTSDCLIIDGDTVSIIDLKMGKGVKVDALDSSQARLYALGALHSYGFLFEGITSFKLAINQPRLDHIDEYVISQDELLAFGEFVKQRSALALSKDAPFTPGEKQCRFCRAKAKCRAFAEYSLSVVAEGFEAVDAPLKVKDLSTISNDEIAALLPQLDTVSGWITAVKAQALAELERGQEVPGYKLVEGRSLRKWSDAKAVEKALRGSKLKVADIFTKTLVSPTQAEKLLGKEHRILKKFVIKPDGKPTLAPLSDKRRALVTDITEGFNKVAYDPPPNTEHRGERHAKTVHESLNQQANG